MPFSMHSVVPTFLLSPHFLLFKFNLSAYKRRFMSKYSMLATVAFRINNMFRSLNLRVALCDNCNQYQLTTWPCSITYFVRMSFKCFDPSKFRVIKSCERQSGDFPITTGMVNWKSDVATRKELSNDTTICWLRRWLKFNIRCFNFKTVRQIFDLIYSW